MLWDYLFICLGRNEFTSSTILFSRKILYMGNFKYHDSKWSGISDTAPQSTHKKVGGGWSVTQVESQKASDICV